MIEIRYASPDGLFQVSLASDQVAQMLAYCRAAKSNETGGILVGYYTATRDCAIITAISGPTKDSRSSRTRFKRGTQGLGQWLVSLWNEPQRSYYLGEWHFHPYAAPAPSGDDSRQMRDIATSPDYHCPEPLLMILGGNPLDKWQLSAHVFVRNAVAQELHQQRTSSLDATPIKQEKVIMSDPTTDSQSLTPNSPVRRSLRL